jgi:hypothetical protein
LFVASVVDGLIAATSVMCWIMLVRFRILRKISLNNYATIIVRLWHLADMATALANVCLWGKSGLYQAVQRTVYEFTA